MKWDEIRKLYPNQWVKLQIINFHTDDSYLYIDEMEVIKPIENDKAATLELTKSIGNYLVFHTSHDIIKTKLIKSRGLSRLINKSVNFGG